MKEISIDGIRLSRDFSASHHLLRSQLCCLEADDAMFRDKSLLPLHQAFFPWWVARRPALHWKEPSLQAVPNHKCVSAWYTPAPNKSSISRAAGIQAPISIDSATDLPFSWATDHWHLCLSSVSPVTADLGKHQHAGRTFQ